MAIRAMNCAELDRAKYGRDELNGVSMLGPVNRSIAAFPGIATRLPSALSLVTRNPGLVIARRLGTAALRQC